MLSIISISGKRSLFPEEELLKELLSHSKTPFILTSIDVEKEFGHNTILCYILCYIYIYIYLVLIVIINHNFKF